VTARGAADNHPHEHSVEEQAVIEQAERTLAEQADISHGEALRRIERYANFNDLRLIDVCEAILDGTVHLLTIRESANMNRRSADSDHEADPA
jgi:hypothetical protein